MKMQLPFWPIGVVLAVVNLDPDGCQAADGERAIRRSDVVFMYDNPDRYADYGCTVLGWAGRSDRAGIERAHQAGVRQFTTSVGFLTEFRRVIDFDDRFLDAAARDLSGRPFKVPWLWDHQYKGEPAWWWCTNSSLYRRYLFARLAENMKAQPDGLHIDDYRGSAGSVTWLGGCFCRHCMQAFRAYLKDHLRPDDLRRLGITNLGQFDYRTFLLDRGVQPAEYNRKRSTLPLADEFYDFHVRANTAFIAEYYHRARQLRGAPLTLCVNSGLTNPQALAIAPQLSYFCCEVRHDAASLKPARHPIYIYKLADGLDRPVASTAAGQDWAYVHDHHQVGLVRTWIALSYALGHTLMAPQRQWCYDKSRGTFWYDGPTEEYAWLYQFIRRHADLLDRYEAVARIAVLYDNLARRHGRGDIEPVCLSLAEANLPFKVVVAGDNWLGVRLTAEMLAGCDHLVQVGTHELTGDQAAVWRRASQGRLIDWHGPETVNAIPHRLRIDGADSVMVVPRARPEAPEAPLVVHLVNRNYDPQQDRCVRQGPFQVQIDASLLQGRSITGARLHAPREDDYELAVEQHSDGMTITVPRLDLWAILELTGN